MDQIHTLRQRAEEHKKKYKTFNVDKFMEWFTSHPPDWQEKEIDSPIPYLNRKRSWETYQVIEYYRTRDKAEQLSYTPYIDD